MVNHWPENILLCSRDVLLLQSGVAGDCSTINAARVLLVMVLVTTFGIVDCAAGLQLFGNFLTAELLTRRLLSTYLLLSNGFLSL